jgi:hypothetical protein
MLSRHFTVAPCFSRAFRGYAAVTARQQAGV